MFERFTERARKVVVFAQEEAASFGHAYVGTEPPPPRPPARGEGMAANALGRLTSPERSARAGSSRSLAVARTVTSRRRRSPALEEGPRAGAARIHAARAQLHRHRAHPARARRGEGGRGEPGPLEPWCRGGPGAPAGDHAARRPTRSRARPARAGTSAPRNLQSAGVLFRGEVLAFEVECATGPGGTAVPQTPQKVSVGLGYMYTAQKDGGVLLGTVDPSDVREGVVRALQGEEFVHLEAGLVRAGCVLEEFPQVGEITIDVTVPRARVPAARPACGSRGPPGGDPGLPRPREPGHEARVPARALDALGRGPG